MSADLAAAREAFLSMVDSIRPDLHRYVSRLVGSALDGEDVVQDALAKGFYALSQAAEPPDLRPWLFRIARNAAIDHLRRQRIREADPLDEVTAMADDTDPRALRAALGAFLALPARQRSAVILKDVLGESLEEIAEHLDTSVEAVKSLLVRGRETLAAQAERTEAPAASPEEMDTLRSYVAAFNARDWDGVRAMLQDEVRLDLVSKSQRQGKSVGMYFGRYAQETGLDFELGTVEGRPAIGVFREGSLQYVVLVEIEGGRVSFIKDFRYVPYMARELVFVAA